MGLGRPCRAPHTLRWKSLLGQGPATTPVAGWLPGEGDICWELKAPTSRTLCQWGSQGLVGTGRTEPVRDLPHTTFHQGPEASLPQSPSSRRLTLELQHPPPLHTHPAQLHLPVHHWRSGSPGQACVAAIHHPTVGPAAVRFPGSCLRGNGQKEKRGPPHFTEEPG